MLNSTGSDVAVPIIAIYIYIYIPRRSMYAICLYWDGLGVNVGMYGIHGVSGIYRKKLLSCL